MRSFILAALACFTLAAHAAPPPPTSPPASPNYQILEMGKTNLAIEFEMSLTDCDAPHTFRVQDGAMNRFSKDGQAPITFIIKHHGKKDVRFHIVKNRDYTLGNKIVPGLTVDSGINLMVPALPEDLRKLGITQMAIKKAYLINTKNGLVNNDSGGSCSFLEDDCTPTGGSDNGGGGGEFPGGGEPSPPPQWRCCHFQGCRGVPSTVCTSGSEGACGADDCNGCCVPPL